VFDPPADQSDVDDYVVFLGENATISYETLYNTGVHIVYNSTDSKARKNVEGFIIPDESMIYLFVCSRRG
jgi:hypothetical protein